MLSGQGGQAAPGRQNTPGTALLALEDVVKIFTVSKGILGVERKLRAVDGVSLELAAGQSLGLVGESGCGKSTLGRLACGLLAPSAGAVRLGGEILPPASAKSWARGRIQMIFQDPASSLNPRLTVLDSVAEPLVPRGVGRAERRARARALLELVGLEEAGGRYPHEFSGGQRQRIAVARALITEPEIVICDEPVSALDASVQAQILNLLRDIQDRFPLSLLFISHDLCVVGFMCPAIAVMYLGRLVEKAPAKNLFLKPAHPYTRALLAAMPEGERVWAQGDALDRLPRPLPGELPSPLNPPDGCRFHPRCPDVLPICRAVAPEWRALAPDWQVRCHLYDQQAALK